jgi:hypothetical protein
LADYDKYSLPKGIIFSFGTLRFTKWFIHYLIVNSLNSQIQSSRFSQDLINNKNNTNLKSKRSKQEQETRIAF